jgi:asparagine synthase (glutamine-hydrolysing)
MMLRDAQSYLPDDILTKVDRASMAVSLEARVPLLDHRVFAFAWSLPLEWKIHRGVGKHILRKVLARYVPPALFERPKTGFGTPIGDWLRSALRPWAEDMLDTATLERGQLLDVHRVRRAWADHLAGRTDATTRLWSVLMFQAWHTAKLSSADIANTAGETVQKA